MYSMRKAARRRQKKPALTTELVNRIGEANRIALGIVTRHGAEVSPVSGRELRAKPLMHGKSR